MRETAPFLEGVARPPAQPTSDNTRFTLRALRALAAQMVHKSLHVKGADNQLSAQLACARSAPPLVVVNLCTLSEIHLTNQMVMEEKKEDLPDHVKLGKSPGPSPRGILLTEGMSLAFADVRLAIGPGGAVEPSMRIEASQDVTPHWLEIALDNSEIAKQRHKHVMELSPSGTGKELSQALKAEFKSSVQASLAAAIAVDAFYAAVKDRLALPAALTNAWRKRRLARYAQVAEVLRRGFRVDPRSRTVLRELLRDVFRYRDLAVHPPANLQPAVRHPDLGFIVEWRFVAFRAHNALVLTRHALSLIAQCTAHPRDRYPKLVHYCKMMRRRLAPLQVRLEANLGTLTD